MFSSGPKKLRRINTTTPTTDEWELPPSHVIIEDCLGEGAFGEVYRGIIRGPIMNPKVHPSMKSTICTTVAIKLLKCERVVSILSLYGLNNSVVTKSPIVPNMAA